jgi:hypothetical protein
MNAISCGVPFSVTNEILGCQAFDRLPFLSLTLTSERSDAQMTERRLLLRVEAGSA